VPTRSKARVFWTAQTLESLVRIPLEAGMCTFFCVVLLCVSTESLRWANHPPKESYQTTKYS